MARERAAGGRTGASRSTACTSGWATTRTPSACCASATPSSTARRPTRRLRSGPGGRRCCPRAPSASRTVASRAGTTGSGEFSPNDLDPGDPEIGGGEFSILDVLRRALQLITDFIESLPDEQVSPRRARAQRVLRSAPRPERRRDRSARRRAGGDPRGLRAARAAHSTAPGSRPRSGRWTARSSATNEALRGLVAEDPDCAARGT